MNDIDLEHVNEIDMECDVDPEDDEFGGPVKAPTVENNPKDAPVEVKELKPIVVNNIDDLVSQIHNDVDMECNLCDDEEEIVPPVKKELCPQELIRDPQPQCNYNNIDLECDDCCCDDDVVVGNNNAAGVDKGMLLLQILELVDKFNGCCDEEGCCMDLVESRTDGAVDKSYWDKLQKKHAKSNKKGAYNTHFHFCGNPEREAELFNKGFAGGSKPVEGKLAGGDGVASVAAGGGEPSAASAGEGGESISMGESFNDKYTKMLGKLINDMDFKVVQDEADPKKFALKDEVYGNEVYPFTTVEELIDILEERGDLSYFLVGETEISDLVKNHLKEIDISRL